MPEGTVLALINYGALGITLVILIYIIKELWQNSQVKDKLMSAQNNRLMDAFVQQSVSNEKLSHAIEGNTRVIETLVERFDSVLCPKPAKSGGED